MKISPFIGLQFFNVEEIGWYSTTAPNGIWAVKWYSEPPVIRCLPIRQETLNVSQIGVTFHGISPPFFIQTWLRQYRRRPFLKSACCSFRNPISFWSVRLWRSMIPGKFFTRCAKFQGVVSVNDCRIPGRLQELLQASLGFLWSFVFARICLDPLGG